MANVLRDDDFPMGRGTAPTHPKRRQLTRLLEYHAPEYDIAPKSEGFQSQGHDRFIRSKYEIITDVIDELMPREGLGRFMLRKNHVWVVREGFNSTTKEVRFIVQERFNKLIKTWNGVIHPLHPRDMQPQPQEQAQGPIDGIHAMNENEAARGHVIPNQEEEIQLPNVGNDAVGGNAAALEEATSNQEEGIEDIQEAIRSNQDTKEVVGKDGRVQCDQVDPLIDQKSVPPSQFARMKSSLLPTQQSTLGEDKLTLEVHM